MPYIATMNTTGYLPWSDDEPPSFDTPGEAWDYLADERRRQEDGAWNIDGQADGEPYSETVDALEAYGTTWHEPDVVYGPDAMGGPLDTAYVVTEV